MFLSVVYYMERILICTMPFHTVITLFDIMGDIDVKGPD